LINILMLIYIEIKASGLISSFIFSHYDQFSYAAINSFQWFKRFLVCETF
jgi:hypothetical protein